jgi:preprotein translocase subunit SecF
MIMSGSKQKFIVNLLIAVLLVFGFAEYGMSYFLREIGAISGKIVSDKKEVYTLETKNMQLSKSRKQYGDIELEAQQAFGAVVSKDKTVDFITEAEKAAEKSKVKLRINTVAADGKVKNNTFVGSNEFEFTVGGDYAGVMGFLYGVENLKYETDIERMDVRKGSFDQYNKDMILMTFKLKLYQKNS